MKKKFLSTFLLSALLITSSVQAFATTPVQTSADLSNNIVDSKNDPVNITKNGNIETRTYSNDSLIQYASYNSDDGDIKFNYSGKQYSFNIYKDYVGYNKPNKYDAVLFAQLQLSKLVPANLALDGIFGQATHSALEKYQQSRGLPVDCIIGPNTWDYLYYDK